MAPHRRQFDARLLLETRGADNLTGGVPGTGGAPLAPNLPPARAPGRTPPVREATARSRAIGASPASANLRAMAPRSTAKIRLLVADDDASLREALGEFFVREGYAV